VAVCLPDDRPQEIVKLSAPRQRPAHEKRPLSVPIMTIALLWEETPFPKDESTAVTICHSPERGTSS
jgi:hypothetical protein